MSGPASDPEALQRLLKTSASLLQRADVPFALCGGLACWARGAGPSLNDVDFILLPEDADRALEVLEAGGFTTERPPESQWLYKAYDEHGEMLDLIFNPSGTTSEEVLKEADELEVLGLRIPVMTATHVLIGRLSSMTELNLDYQRALLVARPLREQIEWDHLRERTADSPFARAFFTMVEGLGIAPTN